MKYQLIKVIEVAVDCVGTSLCLNSPSMQHIGDSVKKWLPFNHQQTRLETIDQPQLAEVREYRIKTQTNTQWFFVSSHKTHTWSKEKHRLNGSSDWKCKHGSKESETAAVWRNAVSISFSSLNLYHLNLNTRNSKWIIFDFQKLRTTIPTVSTERRRSELQTSRFCENSCHQKATVLLLRALRTELQVV